MKNKISDLRDHLFETLESLKDPKKPMDLDRAHAVVDVAKAIIDSARAENDFIKVTNSVSSSGFIPSTPRAPASHQLGAGKGEVRICKDCRNTTTLDPCEHCKAPARKSA